MGQTLDVCRWVYNETLALRKNAWEQEQKSVSNYDAHNLLPEWKVRHPELKLVYSQVLQEVQQRVDVAYKAFFRRVKNKNKNKNKRNERAGYPRFKGKRRYDSFTYPQSGFKLDTTTTTNTNKLYLSKIGNVKIILHRAINGTIKRVNINRRATGKWFACFTVECSDELELEPAPVKQPQPFKDGTFNFNVNVKTVGIDVGLHSFATLSNGEKIENPRFFRHDEKRIAKAQQKVSTQEKGTTTYKKAKKTVSLIYEKIANRRDNFVHQLSRQIVNRFGITVFEDLKVKNMVKDNHLSKSISDVAWSKFTTYTKNKAEEAGSIVVFVNPNNTSQMCSRCGQIVKEKLKDRIHSCECGLVIDRDENAAINILRLGLQSLRKSKSKSKIDRSLCREVGE